MSDSSVGDFIEQQLAGEEPAQEETQPEAEQPRSEQPRTELGRFASSTPPTDEAPADGDVTDEPAAVDAGDDPVSRRLAEKDKMIGRLGQELGELRRIVEQGQQPQPPRYDLSDAESAVIENPGSAPQIAMAALQQGDLFAYDKIVRAWHEVDGIGAIRFENWLAMQQQQQQIHAQTQPLVMQQQAVQARTQLEADLEQLAVRYPDAPQVLGALNPEQDGVPALVAAGLQAQDPEIRQQAWDMLYQHAGRLHNTSLATASQRVAQEQQAQTRQAKAQAAVASASSAPVTEGTGDPFVDNFKRDLMEPSPFSWHAA